MNRYGDIKGVNREGDVNKKLNLKFILVRIDYL